jgi:dTDP-4-dehydrorhamnose 3,5-epimerase
MSENFISGDIKGVVIRHLRRFADARGWVAELFRHDEIHPSYHPVMAYISSSEPGVTRGPHEHIDQTDFFCFIGPSTFKVRLWDNRKDSETFNYVMTVVTDVKNPLAALIPGGVVHAYQNVGDTPGLVINCPNRLYMGVGKQEQVDEIRYEGHSQTIYRIEG